MVALNVRREKFGRFVRKALEDADARNLTIADIERRTGVGSTTFYRWRDGKWTEDPRATKVDAFCEGLEIPKRAAYVALGWGEDGAPAEPEPTFEPELRRIQRRLVDPAVSDAEKAAIREMLKLIARPSGSGRKVAGQD